MNKKRQAKVKIFLSSVFQSMKTLKNWPPVSFAKIFTHLWKQQLKDATAQPSPMCSDMSQQNLGTARDVAKGSTGLWIFACLIEYYK